MALKVGELYGTLRLDDKDFRRGIDTAGSKFQGLVGGVTRGGLIIAGAVAGVGAAAGALSFKLANEASDLNESISKVKVVFGELGDSVVNNLDDAATSMGMSKQAAIEAAGTYGNLFAAMGIGAEENRDMSTSLVRLSADLASFNNMDPTQVLDALRSGLSGETEPLKRLGVNINQARLEAKALEMGLWDGEGAISAAAKAQATYALILEDTSLAQGDFERTSDGMANQQRTLKAVFEDTMAALGQAAVPIFERILPMLTEALTGFAAWATENGPAIGDFLGGMFTVIGEVITFLIDEVVPRLVEAFVFVAEEIVPLLGQAFTFLAEEVFPVIASAVTWIVEEVMPRLIAAFEAVAGWVADNWPTISSIFGQVFGAIASVIEAVWPVIESIASVLFPIVAEAASILFSALDIAFKGIGGVFEAVGNVASTVFNAITGIWEGLGDFFGDVWNNVASFFKDGVNVAIIRPINGLIGFLNNIRIGIPRIQIPGTDIGFGGGHFDPFDIGRIPYLAKGGRIVGAGLALVGEEGPELVALGQGAQVVPLDRAGDDGGVAVHMTVQTREVVDAHDVGLEVRRLVRLGSRRRRRPRLAGAPA